MAKKMIEISREEFEALIAIQTYALAYGNMDPVTKTAERVKNDIAQREGIDLTNPQGG